MPDAVVSLPIASAMVAIQNRRGVPPLALAAGAALLVGISLASRRSGRVATRRAVLVYDGACGFCRRAADAAVRLAGHERLRIADAHDPAELERLPGVTQRQALKEVALWRAGEPPEWGYDAVAGVLCMAPRTRLACPLLRFAPVRALGQVLYEMISQNRHRISKNLGLQ